MCVGAWVFLHVLMHVSMCVCVYRNACYDSFMTKPHLVQISEFTDKITDAEITYVTLPSLIWQLSF